MKNQPTKLSSGTLTFELIINAKQRELTYYKGCADTVDQIATRLRTKQETQEKVEIHELEEMLTALANQIANAEERSTQELKVAQLGYKAVNQQSEQSAVALLNAMSGTLCGILDAYVYETVNQQRAFSLFKVMFTFFERMVTVGNAARVALQYGASGTGTDWMDGANPFGENAFVVYKLLASASDLYVMFQWAYTDSWGASPGNPAKFNNSTSGDGVAIQMAFREDGGSPWAGTTNNDGSDTKAATVWTAGGSTLHVLDRCCSDTAMGSAGACVTNKENMLMVNTLNYDHNRVTCIGDADFFVIFSSETSSLGSPSNYFMTFGGVYTPRNEMTITNPYLLCAQKTSAVVGLTTAGSAVGTYNSSSYYEGGLLSNIPANKVQTFTMLGFGELHNLTWQPNMQVSGGEFDRLPIVIIASEGSDTGLIGQVPTDRLSLVYGLPMETTNAAKTIAFFGTTDIDGQQFAIPWDGGDAPGVNVTTRTWRVL